MNYFKNIRHFGMCWFCFPLDFCFLGAGERGWRNIFSFFFGGVGVGRELLCLKGKATPVLSQAEMMLSVKACTWAY